MKRLGYWCLWGLMAVLTATGIAIHVAAQVVERVPPTWQQVVREHLAACHPAVTTFTWSARCERSDALLRSLVEEK